MRVLFITNSAVLYGANRSMLEAIVELQKQNVKVYVWLPQAGPIEKELHRLQCKYKILRYANGMHDMDKYNKKSARDKLYLNLQCVYKNKHILKEWKIDIIHTNNSVDMVGALLSLVTGIPHVWHIREMIKVFYKSEYDFPMLTHWLMRRADKVICISEAVRQYWEKQTGGKNAEVIYNGFSMERYIDREKDLTVPETYRFFLAGNIGPEKGPMDAVKSVKCLVDRNIHNIHLSIVGDERKPDYVEKMRKYISRHKLWDYIEFLPYQEDLREIRKNSHIALMCSRGEALGRVTVENMAAGVLVIGANSGGTKELIKDGVTGYLYEVADAEQLADKIQHTMENWEEAKKMILTAREEAVEKFAVENYVKKLKKIYEELL